MQRITNNMLTSDLIRTLNDHLQVINDLQNQVTTGKAVNCASDDPAAAGLILELQNSLRQNEQYQENVSNGISWMYETESMLQQFTDTLNLVRTDAIEGSNSAISPEGMALLAVEVNSYLENLLALSNSDYNSKTLFAGSNTNQAAFIAVRDPATNWITQIIPNPDNTSGAIFRQVGSTNSMQISVAGVDVFQPNGWSGNDDLFAVLIELRDALQAGNVTAVAATITEIDSVMSNVSDFTALVGSNVNQLMSIQSTLLNQEINLTDQLSDQEDADLVQVMTQLTLEQNAYQVALNVGAMIIQPSLADFLV
ncbi:MAG: flagellar hook-associated protein FlgL [bacterium]